MSSLPSSRGLRLGRAALIGYTAILIVLSLAGVILFPAYARLQAAEFTPNNTWTPAQTQAGLAQLGMHIEKNPHPEPAWLQVVGVLENL